MHDTVVTYSALGQLCGLVALIRPKQWIKNGFVLAPLIFSGEFLNLGSVKQALLAAVLFCVASSATYIINDIRDLPSDRLHPTKSLTRPLAAGTVSRKLALGMLAVLYAVLVVAWSIVPQVISVIAAYLALNLAYSFGLKHQPVLDIFTIAIGFVLRVYAGAVALSVPISSWMFITTLCLALFLAAVKRRQELSHRGTEARKVLNRYTVALMERYAEMSASAALVFYGMFVMSSKPELVITVPLVLFGLFRYWFVVDKFDAGESPTDALLSDWPLLITVLAWVAICIYMLWPAQI